MQKHLDFQVITPQRSTSLEYAEPLNSINLIINIIIMSRQRGNATGKLSRLKTHKQNFQRDGAQKLIYF